MEGKWLGNVTLYFTDIRGDGYKDWVPSASLLLNSGLLLQNETGEPLGSVVRSVHGTKWVAGGYNCIGSFMTGNDVIGQQLNSSGTTGSGLESELAAVMRCYSAPTLQESLFMEISSSAVMQGRLMKKTVVNKRQELWK
jgi:hypothetical protein